MVVEKPAKKAEKPVKEAAPPAAEPKESNGAKKGRGRPPKGAAKKSPPKRAAPASSGKGKSLANSQIISLLTNHEFVRSRSSSQGSQEARVCR